MKNIPALRPLLFITYLIFFWTACTQPPQQLTKEESVGFAREMEGSIKKGDGDFIDNSFDRPAFLERMKLPDNAEAKGYGKGIMQKLNVGKTISNSMSDQDNFTFIKHYVKEGKHHLIFRLYSPVQSTLNYHDYELLKADNKCKIADVYVYLSGENLSETMGNLYHSIFSKNGDASQQSLEGITDLKEVRALIQRGKNAEAKKMYDDLPGYLKKSKAVLLLNVLICSGLSNDDYSEAIRLFGEKFPNEPNMNLMMVDGYFLQKDYVKMLGAVNSLDSQINKDPLLDFYRYLSYNLLEDEASAKKYLTRLLQNMPDFQKGYQEMIAVELSARHKKEADSLIKIYRTKTRFNQEELDNIIAYYGQ